LNKGDLHSETFDNEVYWFADSQLPHSPLPNSAYLLPAFDEYLISYKNRKAAITREDHAKVISKNGIFWPVLVMNGKISGMWKKTTKKDTITIEFDAFRPHNPDEKRLIEKAAETFGHFSGKKTEVKH